MKRAWGRAAGALMALLVGAGTGCGSEPMGLEDAPGPEEHQLSVLFIGNSLTYANDMPDMLFQLLVQLQEREVYMESLARGNYGLQDHWNTATAHDRIAAGPWDIVVLQQGPSATEGRPSLLEYSAMFAEEIRAVGGTPALYMVWPARSRSFDFPGVSDSYATAADQVDGYLYPAGEAWLKAWEEDPELDLYGPDGFHPSLLGSYLAALVMAHQITGQDLAQLPASIPTPSGDVAIPSTTSQLLEQAAMEANAEFARVPGAGS